jgi:hypothetical protein
MRNAAKLLTVIFTLVLCVNGYSKYSDTEVKQIMDRYLGFMDHKCQGVVESSIIYAAKMKFEYPDQDYNKIIEKLDYLAENDSSFTVRVKAFIAAGCLKNPDEFKWVEKASYEELDNLTLLFQDKLSLKEN